MFAAPGHQSDGQYTTRPGSRHGELPFVSVVVPTSNRASVLTTSLETLLSQRYPAERYEVVVVDNGSRDDTPLLLRGRLGAPRGPRLRCINLTRPDANAARNAGVRAARGDPICFVDDDVLVPPGWVAAMAAAVEGNPDVECLGGPVRVPPGGKVYRCVEHPTAGSTFDEGAAERLVAEVWGGNMAIRRAGLDRVGPFREGLVRAQEWEWEQRLLEAGGRMLYVPEAWVWHLRRHPRAVREAFLRGVIVGRRNPSTPLPRAARSVRRAGKHAGRARCRYGVIQTVRGLGVVAGILAQRLNS